ncbi:hypothetical protein GCM10010357_22520 [Streptomyces luteireticuli]|uniref:Uncharacterized protein n=1 Tax=Streptomyces luteireticuli TaxID=173858 RepID=A0ABN0YMG2_9ACTN
MVRAGALTVPRRGAQFPRRVIHAASPRSARRSRPGRRPTRRSRAGRTDPARATTAAEPRVSAAVFGLHWPDRLAEAARRITVPVEFAMQWDDERIPRASRPRRSR